jgi:hypothetical protein
MPKVLVSCWGQSSSATSMRGTSGLRRQGGDRIHRENGKGSEAPPRCPETTDAVVRRDAEVDGEKGMLWVTPQLVAQVAFGNWTSTGILRHPSFQGLREDVPPRPRQALRRVAAREFRSAKNREFLCFESCKGRGFADESARLLELIGSRGPMVGQLPSILSLCRGFTPSISNEAHFLERPSCRHASQAAIRLPGWPWPTRGPVLGPQAPRA